MGTVKDKLDSLLAGGRITQEQYDELLACCGDDSGEPGPEESQETTAVVHNGPITGEPPVMPQAPRAPEAPEAPHVPDALSEEERLTVALVWEDVTVRGVPGLAAVRVVHAPEEITAQQKGGETLVANRDRGLGDVLPRGILTWLSRGSDTVEIEVPTDMPCDVKTISGDVTLENIRGSVTVRSLSGDLQLERLGRLLSAISTSGDVSMTECLVDGEVTSKSGDMQLRRGHLHGLLKTYSGDVDISSSTLHDAEVVSFSGDVAVEGTRITADSRFRTTSGDVELNLSQHDVSIDADSRSGDITLDGEDIGSSRRHGPAAVGAGTVPVSVRTVSGDISVTTH
jgi:hypothetical protein